MFRIPLGWICYWRRPILSLALLGFVACSVYGQGGPAPVEVESLVVRDVAEGQAFLGTVRPRRRSVIGSAVDGRVEVMHVDLGDFVEIRTDADGKTIGQELVKLRTKTISIEIEGAKADVDLKEKELEELRNGLRPEERHQIAARREAAEALFNYAKQKLDRTEALLKRKGASEDEYEQALSAKLAAEKARVAADLEVELAQLGTRPERIAQAEARLAKAEEEVKRLEDRRNKYTLRAPFAGYVVAKHVEVGDWIQGGAPAVEVVELDPIEIEIGIPERYIRFVQEGMLASIRVDALPSTPFYGTVSKIVPDADTRSRTFPVRFQLKNPRSPQRGHQLKSGMLAQVTIAIGSKRAALLAPKDALVLSERGASLMVVVKGEMGASVRPVPVQFGAVEGSWLEIIDDSGFLQEGMQVVVKGNERLRPNQQIKILPRSKIDPANRLLPE